MLVIPSVVTITSRIFFNMLIASTKVENYYLKALSLLYQTFKQGQDSFDHSRFVTKCRS